MTQNRFRPRGLHWEVSFADREIYLPDGKGARYVARLLARPGQGVSVAELATKPTPTDRASAERLRKAVTNRVRETMARIDGEHPELASHLRQSIRTGAVCVYSPGHTVDWDL